MPNRNILWRRREWQAQVRQATSVGIDPATIDTRPQSPVLDWYQNQIVSLTTRIERVQRGETSLTFMPAMGRPPRSGSIVNRSDSLRYRRQWQAAIRRAASLGITFDTRPQSPVINWYQEQIARIDARQRLITETAPIALNTAAASDTAINDLTFGVEIECIMPQGMTHRMLAQSMVQVRLQTFGEVYNHETRSHWKVITDGSLGDYRRGAEIVSPILQGEAGFEQIRKVCRVLDNADIRVNRRCGFHVHVGASDQPVTFFRHLLKLYAHYETVLDTLVAPSRRNNDNSYCRSTKALVDRSGQIDVATDLRTLRSTYSGGNRFVKLNLEAFWRHGTVEFRHHQGTVNQEKMETWIRLCLGFVIAAQTGVEPGFDTLEDMASLLNMPNVVPYWQRRQSELARVRVAERT